MVVVFVVAAATEGVAAACKVLMLPFFNLWVDYTNGLGYLFTVSDSG